MATFERILIIKPSSLGDVATALPMLCDLKAAYPAAQIDWLIHPSLTAVIEGHDALHELIPFDRKRLAAWWYKPSSFRLFGQLLRKLRSKKYDLVIDAQGLFRSAFLARITGAKRRVGFANAREGAPLVYTDKVRLPEAGKKMLAVDRMRALAAAVGGNISGKAQFRLPILPAALDAAHALLLSAGLGEVRPFIVVIPGARWNTKRWDIDRYTQIVEKLLQNGEEVLLMGSPDEKPLCDQIETTLKSKGPALKNLAGKTGLKEMIAILNRAKLIFGNDSGPLHVAVALGKRTLSIYGPTSPAFVGPYGQLANVIRHEVECHPCRRKECDHHSCMKGVTVELVWERAKKMLPAGRP